MEQKTYDIQGIQVGLPVTTCVNGREMKTGIHKNRIAGPILLNKLHFDGDGQADLVHHGGYDKAVCVFPYDHYAYFETYLGCQLEAAAFGENVTVHQLVETKVCIGDVFQLGEAIVQVSQPRQPCFKLAQKHGEKNLVKEVQETGFTGYYLRVLEEGIVQTNSQLIQLERDPHQVTVHEVNELKYRHTSDIEKLRRVLQVETLAEHMKKSFEKRLKQQT
ncbi:MOSC domain-containing protein [Bacillus sp. NPDC077027]|uniref:MOSC domain-containing protein n=1 Tax=Bacillus sp. NPDC077027 TaxID=3390548 RepID=UPI003D0930A6